MFLFLSGSLCLWYDTAVHDEHELLLSREEVWNHQLQVWLIVFTLTLTLKFFWINLDHHIYWFISALLHATGETDPKPRMGRRGTGKGDLGNLLQRKRPPTLSKSQRKLNPLRDLPPRRASRLWRNGVPPFHVTQDSDTLPCSPPKVQSQSITSLSLHKIKICRQSETYHLQWSSVMLQEVEPKVGLMSTSHLLTWLLACH